MSRDYKLIYQGGSETLRAAPDALLHHYANPEALPEMPQVVRGLGIPHGLPVATPMLVSYIGSNLCTREGNGMSLF